MVSTGEVYADAGLHTRKGDFAEYAAMLKGMEKNIGEATTFAQSALATGLMIPAGVVAAAGAAGVAISAGYEDSIITLQTLYHSQDIAAEKFKWIQQFAASTPFEFPELLEAATQLKSYGLDIEEYGRSLGDTAAAMGKPISQVVGAITDAMQGEFERTKELGVKAIDINNANWKQMGLDVNDAGKTALSYIDSNGQQQYAVVDKNNKQMIAATLMAIWNGQYEGAMETRSKSMTGMWSTLIDNVKTSLAEMAGFNMDFGAGEAAISTLSLAGALKTLETGALSVTNAFAGLDSSTKQLIGYGAAGVAAILALTGAMIGYKVIMGVASAMNVSFGVTLSAAIWPATAIVVGIGLVVAALYLLETRFGLVSSALTMASDAFTIITHYLGEFYTALTQSGGYIDQATTSLTNLFTVLQNFAANYHLDDILSFAWDASPLKLAYEAVQKLIEWLGVLKTEMGEEAAEIRKTDEAVGSFWDTVGQPANTSGIEKTDTAIKQTGQDAVTAKSQVQDMFNVNPTGLVTGLNQADTAGTKVGNTMTKANMIISNTGQIRMGGLVGQLQLVDSNGNKSNVTMNQLKSAVDSTGKVSLAGLNGQLVMVDAQGKTTTMDAQQLQTMLSNCSNVSMSGTTSGINGVGSSAESATGKVNALATALNKINMAKYEYASETDFMNDPSFAGKRATTGNMGASNNNKPGKLKSYSTPNNTVVYENVKIQNYNNNGSTLSKNKMKTAV